jgi:hypothetical protein
MQLSMPLSFEYEPGIETELFLWELHPLNVTPDTECWTITGKAGDRPFALHQWEFTG